uniref:Uncharacterized protein n=1 Tax=Arundo donax TaxID=35708 RepID=A0A0A9HBW2_ARUDO
MPIFIVVVELGQLPHVPAECRHSSPRKPQESLQDLDLAAT